MNEFKKRILEKLNLPKNLLLITIFLLFLIVISTQFYGNADLGDYIDVAKFFSGNYNADIRSSHSYFYGFLSSPFVNLGENFLGMKVMSFLWLILLILSIYQISGRDKKILYLILPAPIFWYMAPMINPIQISSLFFLWGYNFFTKYDLEGKIKQLFYSGVFFGLAWVFWDTVLHFGIFFVLCFFWNKKFSHLIYFIIFVLIGLLPRLILDQILFNFAFFTILKSFTGGFVNSLWAGTIGSGHTPKTFVNIFSTILFLPLFSFLLFKKGNIKKELQLKVFLILSFLMILSNPQIRYTLILAPILLLNLGKILNEKQVKIYLIFSISLSLLTVLPYVVQINYSTNSQEFNSVLSNFPHIDFSKTSTDSIIKSDLEKITLEFPSEVFLVGPKSDDYAILARVYSGENVREFVSIQDYNLWEKNISVLFEKKFMPSPNIMDRRQIWIAGGMNKNENDQTNYQNISYAISLNELLEKDGFEVIREYGSLTLYKKIIFK